MRRSVSIIYIIILVILAGLYYYLNNRPQSDIGETPEVTIAPAEYLFSFEDGVLTSIRIESRDGETVEVARNVENAWEFLLPIETSADQGLVEAAVNQVPTIRVLDHLPNLTAETVGLDAPEYKITVQFTGDVERIINIGVLTPTESGYYINRGDGEILIASNIPLDALIGLLTDPPYLATETPLPPTTEVDTTPGEVSTPQP